MLNQKVRFYGLYDPRFTVFFISYIKQGYLYYCLQVQWIWMQGTHCHGPCCSSANVNMQYEWEICAKHAHVQHGLALSGCSGIQCVLFFILSGLITAEWFHSVFYNHLIHPQTLILSFQINASTVLARTQNPRYNDPGSQRKVFVLVMRRGALATKGVILWINRPLMASLWVQDWRFIIAWGLLRIILMKYCIFSNICPWRLLAFSES